MSAPPPSAAALFFLDSERAEEPRAEAEEVASSSAAAEEGERPTATATTAAALPPRHPNESNSPSSLSPESRLAAAERERDSALERLRQLEESVLRPGFRPPSAWAEREAAHRRERASWASLASEAASRVRELEAKLAAVADGTALEAAERRARESERKAAAARADAEAARAALLDLRLRVESSDLRFTPSARLERGKGTLRLLSGDGGGGGGGEPSSQVSELRAAFEEGLSSPGAAPVSSSALSPRRSREAAAAAVAAARDGEEAKGASEGSVAASASAVARPPSSELSSPARPQRVGGGSDVDSAPLGAPKTPSPFKRSGRRRSSGSEEDDEGAEEEGEETTDDVASPRPSSSSLLEAALAEARSEASALRKRCEELEARERERDRPSKKDAETAMTPPAVSPTAAATATSPSRAQLPRRRRTSCDFDGMPSPLDESDVEAAAAAAERDSLMEELVAAKIELAEAEGERLRAARATIRARELPEIALRALDGVRAALLSQRKAAASGDASSVVDGSATGKKKKGSGAFDLRVASADADGASAREGVEDKDAPALEPEIAAALARAGAEILKAAEEFA